MKKGNLLLINDASRFLCMIASILESRGYQTNVINNADEAFIELSLKNVKLVIIKLHIKQIDRLSLIFMINELSPETKVILLSDDPLFPIEAYQIFVDDFVVMPCHVAKLCRQIIEILESKDSQVFP